MDTQDFLGCQQRKTGSGDFGRGDPASADLVASARHHDCLGEGWGTKSLFLISTPIKQATRDPTPAARHSSSDAANQC
jgi:hypothetical protein